MQIRRLLLVLLFAVATSAHGQGTPGTTFTDLWGDPNEIGWGVTVDHQVDLMFLTFYIYKSDTTPYWVTAVLTRTTPGTGTAFPIAFSGDVNETHGSGFSGAWNAGQASLRKAGTATFTATSSTQATLTYTIDGATVTKNLQRVTLRNVNFQGTYLGGTLYVTSGCTQAAQNGQSVVDGGVVNVVQNGTAFSLTAAGASSTCAYTGTYSQRGQLGNVDGTFTCSDGTAGTFALFAMQWTVFGMSAGVTGQSQFCHFDGTIGGITGNHLLP